jgi:hypothetical protein
MSKSELDKNRKLIRHIFERVRFEGVISGKNPLPDEIANALSNISYEGIAEPVLTAALKDYRYFANNIKSLNFTKDDQTKLLLFALFLSQSLGFLQASVDAHVKASERLAEELSVDEEKTGKAK